MTKINRGIDRMDGSPTCKLLMKEVKKVDRCGHGGLMHMIGTLCLEIDKLKEQIKGIKHNNGHPHNIHSTPPERPAQ